MHVKLLNMRVAENTRSSHFVPVSLRELAGTALSRIRPCPQTKLPLFLSSLPTYHASLNSFADR